MSGHKPGTDHAENLEDFSGSDGTAELIDSTTNSATGTSSSATTGGRTRIGAVAITGALVLGGAFAYGVSARGASPDSQVAQAQSMGVAAEQAAAAQRAAAAQAAAEESAAQHDAAVASAKAAADKAAAEKAAADKAAADAAAKAAAERAAAAAQANRDAQRPPLPTRSSTPAPSRSTSTPPKAAYGSAQAIAQQIVPAGQYQCFATIIQRESGWNVHASNPSSGAYGLPQALPGSKMASAGPDWQNDPATQIKWALSYMDNRYGSPCGALSFWNSHGWY